MRATRLFDDFFENERSAGLVLIGCTLASLILANSPLQHAYSSIWNYEIGGHHFSHWINDGLMTIFFLLVGLELEREIYVGELSTLNKAMLPVVAACGGMIVPAALHLAFNYGTPTQSGAGIPMATDIAFALAGLSLVGKRVPLSLKVFLTALAVIDDLGAILVIALFYTDSLQWTNLIISLSTFGVLLVFNRMKVRSMIPYLIGGVIMWWFMLHSGVHATISGVLLAFAMPFQNGDPKSTSYILQRFLHRPVPFLILPLFALANTSVALPDGWVSRLADPNSIGIFVGLVIGKPLGISLFSYVSTALKFTRLPSDINWKHIVGAGMLGGIGFTMSIFITLLAFSDQSVIDQSKIVIALSSTIAGIAGYLYLSTVVKPSVEQARVDN
ncbi:Na+/H+ antiporter NhaA [Chryseolinea sp. T2]|uniref:Na+/H+ antiporter NhaA n=1 Tax=Chryseolinea sp. T2 TaxID=3129255 RepID=UPI003076BD21